MNGDSTAVVTVVLGVGWYCQVTCNRAYIALSASRYDTAMVKEISPLESIMIVSVLARFHCAAVHGLFE